MSGNDNGPWGGKGTGGGGPSRPPSQNDGPKGSNGSGNQPQRPGGDGNRPKSEIDDLVQKGREQFRVLVGGGGDGSQKSNGGQGGGFSTRSIILIAFVAFAGFWIYKSLYTVKPEERSVELLLGKYLDTGEPGLNFAPWPIVTHEVQPFTTERNIEIGTSSSGQDAGLMLTGDENIVDIDFQVVWNVDDLQRYLFNLADPEATIEAVSESSMREIIAQSELSPILNRDRGAIADRLKDMIQTTLDSYGSGVNIVRVNFDKADPPQPVIASFRDVQDAEQERDRLQNVADAYANRVMAGARGDAAKILETAEGYRAEVVNQAEGDASRFMAVLGEYRNAPEVTRKRIYLETMEKVFGDVDVVVIDGEAGGQGPVPYLSLNELRRNPNTGAANTQTTNGGSN